MWNCPIWLPNTEITVWKLFRKVRNKNCTFYKKWRFLAILSTKVHRETQNLWILHLLRWLFVVPKLPKPHRGVRKTSITPPRCIFCMHRGYSAPRCPNSRQYSFFVLTSKWKNGWKPPKQLVFWLKTRNSIIHVQ